jgi:small-conductance mechanosensitive channel
VSWIFENAPTALAVAAGITGGLLLIVFAVAWIAKRRLAAAASTTGDVDDFLLDVVQRTSFLLVILPAAYAGTRALKLDPEAAALLRTFARLSLIAQTALWSGAVIDFVLRRYRRRRVEADPAAITTIRAFRMAALAGVWAIAVLVGLDNLGIDITALVTGLGIGGVAIALATPNILGDLFASLSIVLDKPFVVGDFIRSGEQMGVVEQIGLKTTRVRALTGEQLVFSNADLLQSRIQNFKRMNERRVVFRIGVTYQTTAELLERIPSMVRGIIEAAGEVRFDRAHFAAFGPSSYDFELVYYVLSADYNVFMDIQQTVNLAIVRAFEREGIEFAYPTQTLFVQSTNGARPSAAA